MPARVSTLSKLPDLLRSSHIPGNIDAGDERPAIRVGPCGHGRVVFDRARGDGHAVPRVPVGVKPSFAAYSASRSATAPNTHSRIARGLLERDESIGRHIPEHACLGAEFITIGRTVARRSVGSQPNEALTAEAVAGAHPERALSRAVLTSGEPTPYPEVIRWVGSLYGVTSQTPKVAETDLAF